MPDEQSEPKKRPTDPDILSLLKMDRTFAATPPGQRQWILDFLNNKYGKKPQE